MDAHIANGHLFSVVRARAWEGHYGILGPSLVLRPPLTAPLGHSLEINNTATVRWKYIIPQRKQLKNTK